MNHNASISPAAAHRALTDHRLYSYRGCGPDIDDPTRAVGDVDVSIDVWAPYTGDGPEPQLDRLAREKAAVAICGYCPVQALCRTYATSHTRDGDTVRLAEPEGIWGGMLALERHRQLIAQRTAATAHTGLPEKALAEARTPQKRALLVSLSRNTDDELVAYRAGMDLRTANWHRSALCGLLGLDRERATRQQLLEVAVAHDLLPKRVRVVPDPWPVAAAPTTDGARQRRIAAGAPVQLALDLWDGQPTPRPQPAPPARPAAPTVRRTARPRLRLVTRRWTADPLPLIPVPAVRLEAAA